MPEFPPPSSSSYRHDHEGVVGVKSHSPKSVVNPKSRPPSSRTGARRGRMAMLFTTLVLSREDRGVVTATDNGSEAVP